MAKVVTSIPKLDTLILIKHMLKKHSFQVSMIIICTHPYLLTVSLVTFAFAIRLTLCIQQSFDKNRKIKINGEEVFFFISLLYLFTDDSFVLFKV